MELVTKGYHFLQGLTEIVGYCCRAGYEKASLLSKDKTQDEAYG